MTSTPLTIHNEHHTVTFDQNFGGRAVSWVCEGFEILASPHDQKFFGGNYVMGPWTGRLADASVIFDNSIFQQPINEPPWALHGSTPSSEPILVEKSESHIVFEHFLNDELPTWPQGMRIRHSWQISGATLVTEIIVCVDKEPFPASVGWHPWFKKSIDEKSSYQLEAQLVAQFKKDEHKVVRGETTLPNPPPWDDAFIVNENRIGIHWGDALSLQAVSSSPYFVIFDEPENFVCIEPMSSPPNGPNLVGLGLCDVVTQQNPLRLTVKWTSSTKFAR